MTFHFCTHLVGNDGILVNDDIHELKLVGAALEVQEDGGVTMHEAGLANDLHLGFKSKMKTRKCKHLAYRKINLRVCFHLSFKIKVKHFIRNHQIQIFLYILRSHKFSIKFFITNVNINKRISNSHKVHRYSVCLAT
jgi:hypothetical protein